MTELVQLAQEDGFERIALRRYCLDRGMVEFVPDRYGWHPPLSLAYRTAVKDVTFFARWQMYSPRNLAPDPAEKDRPAGE